MASLNGDSESVPITTTSIRSSTDPIRQWERALKLVIAANIFIRGGPVDQEISAHEGSSREQTGSNRGQTGSSRGQNGSSRGQNGSNRGQNGNPLTQSPMQAIPSQDNPSDRDFVALKIIHGGLVKQLSDFGIVLTLLITVMSVAILQPPGSFDGDGHVRPYRLVACYLLFASLSFLLAGTGLLAVIVGQASLYRPQFFLELQSEHIAVGGLPIEIGFDDTSTLVSIIRDNLSRVKRLKTYLGFSLAMGMTAFVCGAFAILGPGWRNLWMAIGTICVSTVILAIELMMTWTGPALPDNVLARLQRLIY